MALLGSSTLLRARIVRLVLVLVGISPFLPPLTREIPGLQWIGWGLEQWFDAQCHRDPERSLVLFATVLPVCIRCLGIYLGLGFGALIMRPSLSSARLWLWVSVAGALMVTDVAVESLGWHKQWPLLRLITGLLLSYPVGVALVQAARGQRE